MKIRRRFFRIFLFAAVFALYFIIGAFLPFSRTPQIEDSSVPQARALKMQQDIVSPDRAAILETNASALDERIRLMNQAQHEIIIVTYDLRDGESTRDLFAVALRRANEGVKVRLLVDGISGFFRMKGNDLFHAMAAHPNIEIRIYNMLNPLLPWKTMGRMHDKYILADNSVCILGGRNTFDYFIGEYPVNHRSYDREALIYNSGDFDQSVLKEIRDYFENIWAMEEVSVFKADSAQKDYESFYAELSTRYDSLFSANPALFQPFDYMALTEPTQGVWLISNLTGLYVKEPAVFQQLYELMRLTENDIIIHSPYAVLNDYMQKSLENISSKTPVTLMINAVENGDNMVASSDYVYHRRDVLSSGVKLLEYAGGESYHGKSIVIDDDISIIGSFNMDLRSAYVDTELMLVIRSERVNAQLRDNMDALHRDCREVTRDNSVFMSEQLSIPKAPLWKRVLWRTLGLLLQPIRILV